MQQETYKPNCHTSALGRRCVTQREDRCQSCGSRNCINVANAGSRRDGAIDALPVPLANRVDMSLPNSQVRTERTRIVNQERQTTTTQETRGTKHNTKHNPKTTPSKGIAPTNDCEPTPQETKPQNNNATIKSWPNSSQPLLLKHPPQSGQMGREGAIVIDNVEGCNFTKCVRKWKAENRRTEPPNICLDMPMQHVT